MAMQFSNKIPMLNLESRDLSRDLYMCWSVAIFWARGVRALSAVDPFLQNKVIGLAVSKLIINVKAYYKCHHKAYL